MYLFFYQLGFLMENRNWLWHIWSWEDVLGDDKHLLELLRLMKYCAGGRPVRTGWTLLPLPLPHCTLSTVFSRLGVRCVSLALYWSHVGAPATSRGDEGTSALLGPPSKVGLCIFNCDSAPEMSPCGSHGFTGITLSTQMFGLVCCLT